MATLSHELRNPLNTILGFTELLVNGTYGPLSDLQKRPLGHIEVGGRQLLCLINDVLDLARVKAGQIRLEQVALEAAIKFTPAGGTVELDFHSGADGGPRLCVSDNGIGLTADDLGLIFEDYGQVAAHRAVNPEGIGLGLPVSRKLATLMGGTRIAVSKVGVGSRFCLTLPRIQATLS